ncbi:sulfotransferase family protein [Streptomyces cacaoi]|uniref:Sulfotransferase n=1 Tax=Streptomyces cacaoi TaxID=1898 RepID=A0A4Y3R150_STRCI|nr:sulfotransferase [Streptomyces cacaoi]GEB51242.1 hypothetical protein SCA03_37930 [Streptomyces cacaoi]
MSAENLTFVVGTGRSGSTALSRVLREHPDVLSLNELGATALQPDTLCEEPLTGKEFWSRITAPNELFNNMIRSEVPLPEFLYDMSTGRYSTEGGGIPALSLMVLPHLSDDPDGLLDTLEPKITSRPSAPCAAHWETLFEALAAHQGGARAVVERSGFSTGNIPLLHAHFPHARFVHLHRDGPDCALSMSRHAGFRMIMQLMDMAELAGVDSPRELTDEHKAVLPPHLSALLEERFDPALLWERELPVARFAGLWSRLVQEATEHLGALPPDTVTTLSYERMLDEPREQLTRLAGFLGVPPLPDWLDRAATMLDPGRRGAALRLPPDELAAVRSACAPGAAVLGR